MMTLWIKKDYLQLINEKPLGERFQIEQYVCGPNNIEAAKQFQNILNRKICKRLRYPGMRASGMSNESI